MTDPLRKIGAEFVGTFFATLVPTSVDVIYYTDGHMEDVSRWLARGFITIAVIYALSGVSGAHIDPAVSLGFFARRVMSMRQLLYYWIAQFAGAFAAAGLALALWGHLMVLGASHPSAKYTDVQAFLTEIILTFLVMLVILGCAEQEAVVGKQAALAVGLSVAACGFFAGHISGASMNPARSIAPQILGGAYHLVWIYLAGPCIGAVLAAGAAWLLLGAPDEGEAKAARGE